jgi:hypothetical protein
MGWIISVGRAGSARKQRNAQAGEQVVSVSIDVQGVPARIKVFNDAGAIPAWQARRVWRNLLTTLAYTE